MSIPVTTRGPQTEADWTASTTPLEQFQIGIAVNPATGAYAGMKMGNGRSLWPALPYMGGSVDAAAIAAAGGLIGQTAVLQADFPKTNDTLSVVTGWSTPITLTAGKTYEVQTAFWMVGGGSGWLLDFVGGSVTATGAVGRGNYIPVQLDDTELTNFSTPLAASTDGGLFLTFIIQVSAGGTLIPRLSQQVTDVTAAKILKYSTYSVTEIVPLPVYS